MKIQIIQTNEISVPDESNEYASMQQLESKYYQQCANNPDKMTKEIRIIHEHKNGGIHVF